MTKKIGSAEFYNLWADNIYKEQMATEIKMIQDNINKQRLKLMKLLPITQILATNQIRQSNNGLVNAMEDLEGILAVIETSYVGDVKVKSKGKVREFLVVRTKNEGRSNKPPKDKFTFILLEITKGVPEKNRIQFTERANSFEAIKKQMVSLFGL